MIYSKCLFQYMCISTVAVTKYKRRETLIMGKYQQGYSKDIIQEDDYELCQRMKLLLLEISKRNILLLRLAPMLENAWV